MAHTAKTSASIGFGALLARALGSCILFAALFVACHAAATHSNADNATTDPPDCAEPNCSGPVPDYENAPQRIVTVDDVCLIFDAIVPFRSSEGGWTSGLARDGFGEYQLSDLERFDELPQIHELMVADLGGVPAILGGRRYVAGQSAIMADNFGSELDILGGLPDWARPEFVLDIDDCRESPTGLFVKMSVGRVLYVPALERASPRGISGCTGNLWLEVTRTKDGAQATFVAFQDN